MIRNIRIKTQIISALIFLTTLLTMIGVFGLHSVDKTADALRNISIKNMKAAGAIEKIRFRMEINRRQVLQALQQNAGLVEEAAATASAREDQAQTLWQTSSVFRVAELETAALSFLVPPVQTRLNTLLHVDMQEKRINTPGPSAIAGRPGLRSVPC